MTQIAYLLLAHKEPARVAAQAQKLSDGGDYVAIHYDAKAPRHEFRALQKALAAHPRITFSRKRIRCGWGEWGIVAATLSLAQTALEAFQTATHFYLISGDCAPIKPAQQIRAFVAQNEMDHIESAEFFTSFWVKSGIRDERITQWHFLNERRFKWLFYANIALQKRLGLRRKIPKDLQLHIGSQWWCLRRKTLAHILTIVEKRPDIIRLFRYSWIPDETFFQTLVRKVTPQRELSLRPPTLVMFGQYGLPVTFHNDHKTLLAAHHQPFARKISPHAHSLHDWLDAVYRQDTPRQALDNAPRLYDFLTHQRQMSLRYATRFWQRPPPPTAPRQLKVILCKKRIVGKRLVGHFAQHSALNHIHYLFDEEDANLPDLGGLQRGLQKRLYNPVALLDVLLDYWRGEAVAICLDPAQLDLLRDLYAARGGGHYDLRLLHVSCAFTDAALMDHARYNGIVAEETPPEDIRALFPMLRHAIDLEARLLHQAGFNQLYTMREGADPTTNAAALAHFLSVHQDKAQEILRNDFLFND